MCRKNASCWAVGGHGVRVGGYANFRFRYATTHKSSTPLYTPHPHTHTHTLSQFPYLSLRLCESAKITRALLIWYANTAKTKAKSAKVDDGNVKSEKQTTPTSGPASQSASHLANPSNCTKNPTRCLFAVQRLKWSAAQAALWYGSRGYGMGNENPNVPVAS